MEHHRIIKDKIVYEVYEFLEIIGSYVTILANRQARVKSTEVFL
jgi:hypothetical protein